MKLKPRDSNTRTGFPARPAGISTTKALLALFLLLALIMVACSPDEEEATQPAGQESTVEESVEDTTEDISADDAQEAQPDSVPAQEVPADGQQFLMVGMIGQTEPLSPEESWQASAHADSYVLSKEGRNDNCARCHSPAEWLPGPDDIPESCLTCKFDVDTPDPVVTEELWAHIACKTCHRMDDDEVEPEFAWLDIAVIEEYIDLDSTTELCRKCHEESDLPDHKPAIAVSEEHGDLTCTECHDVHTTVAYCSSSGCHEDILASAEVPTGHDEDHKNVSCMACHDAGDLQVGPAEDTGIWVTMTTVSSDGQESIVPHSSHSAQTEVACDRCHFVGNPWDLSDSVATEP